MHCYECSDGVNTEICEETFVWLSGYKFSMRHMNKSTYNLFLLRVCDLRNHYTTQRLMRKGYMGAASGHAASSSPPTPTPPVDIIDVSLDTVASTSALPCQTAAAPGVYASTASFSTASSVAPLAAKALVTHSTSSTSCATITSMISTPMVSTPSPDTVHGRAAPQSTRGGDSSVTQYDQPLMKKPRIAAHTRAHISAAEP
jgi:hypothetical protein